MRKLTMFRLTVACLLGVCVCLYQADAPAQDAPAPVPTAPEQKGETVIRKAPLDAIVLIDDKGLTYKLYGDWSLTVMDDFHDYVMQKGEQNPMPSFTLQNVSATSTVVDNYVEADVQIELSTSGYQPVRIPLGFKGDILPSADQIGKPPFRYTGSGSALLDVDSKEGQYIAIVVPQTEPREESEDSENLEKPAATQQHTLSFLLWIPLSQNSSGEYRLPLSFPPSLTSQFLLEVPMASVTASVTQGSILTTQEDTEQQATLLSVQGIRTDTEITWTKKNIEIVDDRPVLLVERASIDVSLEERATVYNAVIPVSSAAGSFEQLHIRLPQGSVLDREATDRYAVAGDYAVGEVDEESVVTVQFPQKTAGPVSLRLKAIQQFEGDVSNSSRALTGFEVIGAERQSGILSVSVFLPEMKPHWEPVRGIRRAESGSPSAAISVTPNTAASDTRFEFISQPFLLNVLVVSPQTRINVKPVYKFHFKKGQVTMEARLAFTVSGSKTDVLYFRLPDEEWEYNFGTSSPVDVVDVKRIESGELMIPLRSQMSGPINIEVNAHRDISSEDEQLHRIVLPMPKPRATWSEPAEVVISLADYIEMQPIDASYSGSPEQRTSGMTRQPRRTVSSSDLQQESLVYRAESTDAVFVADLVYRQQKINVSMQTDVRLLEEYNQITQTISYHAAYAPIDRLYFLLPESLESNSDIQIRLDNRISLEFRDRITDVQDSVPTGWKRKMVLLSEPKYQFQLTFQYFSSAFTVPADVTSLCSLLFVYPVDVPVSDHRVHFFAPSDYKIELQEESKLLWESFREPRRLSSRASGTFRSVQSPNKIALSISVSEKNDSGTTIVERAWLQTWLSGMIRHDRATYLLKTAKDSVALQLPPDAMREYRIRVWVNRQLVTTNVSPTGLLMLPILPEQQNRSVEVSVEYRHPFEISSMEVSMVLPTFSKDTLIQYEFWQIFPPLNTHVIACSGGWALEYDWRWNGLFFGRVPSIRKEDIGFEAGDETVSSGASQYLFSHLHPSGYATLYIVSRSLIVLCSSGIALLIGLVLIYVRQARYAGSLFGLGVVLIAVLLYQLPLVLLMLQAAVFGVFLALGAGYVYRIFHREKQWVPSAFPAFDEMAQPYLTPIPPQTVHEVVMDEESASKSSVVSTEPKEPSPNGQS